MSGAVTTDSVAECALPTVIDEQALSRSTDILYSIPNDDNDLSQGFLDITCGRFANAINHAASWLHANIGESTVEGNFDVIAYTGPNDLRYPILAVAAAKVGKQVLQPSYLETRSQSICPTNYLLSPRQDASSIATSSCSRETASSCIRQMQISTSYSSRNRPYRITTPRTFKHPIHRRTRSQNLAPCTSNHPLRLPQILARMQKRPLVNLPHIRHHRLPQPNHLHTPHDDIFPLCSKVRRTIRTHSIRHARQSPMLRCNAHVPFLRTVYRATNTTILARNIRHGTSDKTAYSCCRGRDAAIL
jgi:hypothetical protein